VGKPFLLVSEVALFSAARHSGIPASRAMITPRAFGCGCAALRKRAGWHRFCLPPSRCCQTFLRPVMFSNLWAALVQTHMAEYKVQFEVFEGPLDLLLYLVKKEEVDIYQVNLTKLATEFLEYVELMRELDLDIAGEFLVMAATLMYIKSRELLPRDQQVVDEQDVQDEEDPRWELIKRLVEYKKFKDAATRLQELEVRQEQTYKRQPQAQPLDRAPVRTQVSVFDLIAGVNAVLKRIKEKETGKELVPDRWTVSEKIEFIRSTLAERGRVSFLELFGDSATRGEVVATFLALLELMRLGVARAIQLEPFGEIEITSAEPDDSDDSEAQPSDVQAEQATAAAVESTSMREARAPSDPEPGAHSTAEPES